MANPLGSLLDEAKQTITGERQDQYGAPEDSFDRIAAYWTTYLGRPVSALDVAHLMALLKLARAQGQGFRRDNYVDLAGYAAIAADRLAPKVLSEVPKASDQDEGRPAPKPAPEPERSCGTCLYDPTTKNEPCTYCENSSEWTDW